jgi:hypothetical protein
MFELNNCEMKLWSSWSTSSTRTNHIIFLIIIGFSTKVAIGQANLDFKTHCSGFGDAPEDEIVDFERYSCEKNATFSSHDFTVQDYRADSGVRLGRWSTTLDTRTQSNKMFTPVPERLTFDKCLDISAFQPYEKQGIPMSP